MKPTKSKQPDKGTFLKNQIEELEMEKKKFINDIDKRILFLQTELKNYLKSIK